MLGEKASCSFGLKRLFRTLSCQHGEINLESKSTDQISGMFSGLWLGTSTDGPVSDVMLK